MTKTIKFPEFKPGESAAETLLNFYAALGWDGKQNLNVKRVAINKQQALELADLIASKEENKNLATLFCLDYGPSPNEDVPYGKVKLYNDWMTA